MAAGYGWMSASLSKPMTEIFGVDFDFDADFGVEFGGMDG